MLRRHEDPIFHLGQTAHIELLQFPILVQWEVMLQQFFSNILIQELTDVDACAILVFRRDDVMDQEDFVTGCKDRALIGIVVLGMALVHVGEEAPVFEAAVRPARKILAVLCVSTQELRLHLQLVFHPRCCGTKLFSISSDLDDDFVAISAVEAKEVETAILHCLHQRFTSLRPSLHLVFLRRGRFLQLRHSRHKLVLVLPRT